MSVRIVRSIPQTITHALWLPDGTAAAPALAFSNYTNRGFYVDASGINAAVAGVRYLAIQAGGIYITSDTTPLVLGSALDVLLYHDAANTLALKNGTSAQEFRAYGTTTGPKYISVKHDGTDGVVDTAASSGVLKLGGNATDIQWMKALVNVGATTAASIGKIGGVGPATAAQYRWMQLKTNLGTAVWAPIWK